MKSSKLKNYDWFLPEERFQLAVAALTRDDETEVEKLLLTCPKKTYTQADIDYTFKIKALRKVLRYLCFLIDKIYVNTGVCSMLNNFFSEMIVVFEEGFKLGCQTNGKQQADESILNKKEKTIKQYCKYRNSLRKKTRERLVELKSVFQAFTLFCEEIGINHNAIIEWLGKDDTPMQSYSRIKNEDVKVKTKLVESEKNYMLKMWKEIVKVN